MDLKYLLTIDIKPEQFPVLVVDLEMLSVRCDQASHGIYLKHLVWNGALGSSFLFLYFLIGLPFL